MTQESYKSSENDKNEKTSLLHNSNSGIQQKTNYPKWLLVNIALGVLLFGGFVGGVAMVILGPTLPDIRILTHSSLQQASNIFVWCGLFGFAGSIAGSFILVRFNPFLVIFLCALTKGVFYILTSLWRSYIGFVLFIGTSTFFMGMGNAGTLYLCYLVWKGKGDILSQAYRLVFSIGKSVAPLLAAQFLLYDSQEQNVLPSTGESGNSSYQLDTNYTVCKPLESMASNYSVLERTEINFQEETNGENDLEETHVQYVFVILGSICIFCSLFFLIAYVYLRKHGIHQPFQEISHNSEDTVKQVTPKKDFPRHRRIALIGLSTLFCFLFSGLEMGYSGLLVTWLVDGLQWSKQTGIVMLFMYQSLKIIGCILGTILINFTTSYILFSVSIIFCLIATILQLIQFHTEDCAISIWIITGVLSLSTSTLYPSIYGIVQSKTQITGRDTSLMNGAFYIGVSTFMPLVTAIFIEIGIIAFPVMILAFTSSMFIIYLIITILIFYPITSQQNL